jgi:hypothetical protein
MIAMTMPASTNTMIATCVYSQSFGIDTQRYREFS